MNGFTDPGGDVVAHLPGLPDWGGQDVKRGLMAPVLQYLNIQISFPKRRKMILNLSIQFEKQ